MSNNPGIAEEIRKALGVSEQFDEEGRVAWLEVRGNCRQWLRWQQGEIERLRAERDEMLEALRYYEQATRGTVINDFGQRARDILTKYKQG